MHASVAFGGKSLSQYSQLGRICSAIVISIGNERSWSLATPRPGSWRLLLSALCRARAHGLGLKRPVAHVEVGLEPVLALGLEQLLAKLVVGRVRKRAEGSFEQKAGINAGGLHAHHRNGLVEPHRRLRHEADAFRERARRLHELIV